MLLLSPIQYYGVSKLTRILIDHCLLCKPEDKFGELRNFVFPDSSLCFTLYQVPVAYCGELHILYFVTLPCALHYIQYLLHIVVNYTFCIL
jgi:hypothetical protein